MVHKLIRLAPFLAIELYLLLDHDVYIPSTVSSLLRNKSPSGFSCITLVYQCFGLEKRRWFSNFDIGKPGPKIGPMGP